MDKITFDDKVTLRTTTVAAVNKVRSGDMNEIKTNFNALIDSFVDDSNFRDLNAGKPIVLGVDGIADPSVFLPVLEYGDREYDVGNNTTTSPGTGRYKVNTNNFETCSQMAFHDRDIITNRDSEDYNGTFAIGTRLMFVRSDIPADRALFELTALPIEAPAGFPIWRYDLTLIAATGGALPQFPDGVITKVYISNDANKIQLLDKPYRLTVPALATEVEEIHKTPFKLAREEPTAGVIINSYSIRIDDGLSSYADLGLDGVTRDAINNFAATASRGVDYWVKRNVAATREGRIFGLEKNTI